MREVKGLKFVVFRGGAGEVNKAVPHRDKVLAHPVGVAGYADLVSVFVVPGKVLNNALQGYKRLNMKAIEQIKKGGILFTFSCSQAVSKEEFRKSVFAAAANTKRNVRILHQLTQPADHPISIYHPEGEYLKGLVLEVE